MAGQLTTLGPCTNCRTYGRLTNAVVTTDIPTQGVVVTCMICHDCKQQSNAHLYPGWIAITFEKLGIRRPAPVAGRAIVQVLGSCFTCLASCELIADMTGETGKRTAPMACSAECEAEAYRILEG